MAKSGLGTSSLGKSSLGKLSLGKLSLGKLSLGKLSLGKLSLGLGALPLGWRQGASFAAEPFTRGRLGLGAVLRTEVRERLVEDGVALADAFGDKMPFEALDLVHRGALSAQQHMREAVLCDRTVLAGGLAQQCHRGGLVLWRAGAVIERDGVFDFGVDMVGERCRLQQPHRLFQVFRNAVAFLVEGRKRVLGFRVAGIGGDT